jgi:cytochrome c-type biogenesis protein CcmH
VGRENDSSSTTPWFRSRLLQLIVLALALPFLFGASDADARYNSLGHKMMCMCGCSQILLECNHVGCTMSDKMDRELASQIQRGDNDDLILSNFVSSYGATALAAPIRGGFDRVAWIIPFVVFALATGVAVWVVRMWKGRGGPRNGGPGDGSAVLVSAETPALDRFREQARKETEF